MIESTPPLEPPATADAAGPEASVAKTVVRLRTIVGCASAAEVIEGVAEIRRMARGEASTRAWADAFEARVRITDNPSAVDPLIERSLQGFDRVKNQVDRAIGYAYVAQVLTYRGRIEAALETAAMSSALLERVCDPEIPASPMGGGSVAFTLLIDVFGELGLTDLAADHARRLVAGMPTRRDTWSPAALSAVAVSLVDVAYQLRTDAQVDAAGSLLSAAASYVDDLDPADPSEEARTALDLATGWLLVESGQYDDARAHLRRLLTDLTGRHSVETRGLALLALGRCEHRAGDLPATIEALKGAVRAFDAHPYARWHRSSLYELGIALAESGDSESALRMLEQHLRARLVRDRARARRWAELFQHRTMSVGGSVGGSGRDRRSTGSLDHGIGFGATTGLGAELDDVSSRMITRQYGEQLLDRMVLRHHRTGVPFALALVCVESADRVAVLPDPDDMRAVAKSIRAGIRDNDVICRWTATEIIVLMPGCAEDVCASAVARAVQSLDPDSHVTLGVAGMPACGDRLALMMTAERGLAARRGESRR